MKKVSILLIGFMLLIAGTAYSQENNKLVSSKSHIKFHSHTSVEDIEANNYTAVGTINTETGEFVFSVPMQGFEFEIALMQKHFNSDKFLDTQAYPKAKIKGKITNLDNVDFTKDGSYPVSVEGELTIKGVTKTVNEKASIMVKSNTVHVQSSFNVVLADYGIEFLKGKPSKNIAQEVEVTVHGEYSQE